MPKRKIPLRIRVLVVNRAKGCCEYCFSQEQFATHDFSIDHVLPLMKGGTDELENLALCCQGCNNYKHVSVEIPDWKQASLPGFLIPDKTIGMSISNGTATLRLSKASVQLVALQ